MFTPATLSQIDLGKEVTRQLKGKAIVELQPILELCINKDSKWWLAGRQRLAKAPEGKDKAISKDFCNQLLGSESWFKTRYEANVTTDLVIVHPSSKFGDAASPSANMRVMDVQSLEKLKMAIDGFAKAVVFGDTTFAPPARIAEALVHFGLDSASIIARYTVGPT